MASTILTAVFSSRAEALHAREALLKDGFPPGDLTISADLTMDGVAAEAPGQAYENQGDAIGARLIDWVKSGFESARGGDAEQAQRMADVQRGGAALTISCSGTRRTRALELLELCRPVAVRRD